MPVVIKELVITATVAPLAGTPEADADAADASAGTLALSSTQQQLLLQDCVAQVLAVLHEQAER
jgi:hypothetical protein